MHLRNLIPISILTLVLILVTGCERGEFTWGKKVGDITYSGNAVLLGAEELAQITDVTDNEIVFSDEVGEIKNITSKSILVLGVSEKTPYGLLRRVSGIQSNGSELVITTSDAFINDAVKEGTIKFKAKLLEKDFKVKSKIDGVLVKGLSKSFDGLAITLDNLEIFRDGTKTASLDGAIGISPEIDLTIEIQLNELKGINLVTTLNKIDEVTATSNSGFSGKNEIVAAEFIHSPIIIDSLVFVPEVAIMCGFDGTASGEVISGVRQDRVIISTIDYSNARWSENPVTHSEDYDFIRPSITDNSDMKVLSGPEITVRLFGIPLLITKATGYYTLEAEKTSSPFWKLFIGNDGQNTIRGDILGMRENYSQNLGLDALEVGNANDNN